MTTKIIAAAAGLAIGTTLGVLAAREVRYWIDLFDTVGCVDDDLAEVE